MLFAIALILCVGIAWGVGASQGAESVRRDQTPAAYRQAAKADTQRACVGVDRLVLFECVYNKVEASADQAHEEQDLSAQQRAAGAALVAAIVSGLGIFVSFAGIYYIRRTIRQGQEALEHARGVSQTELRPYVYVSEITLGEKGPHDVYTVCVKLRNYGRTPAIHMHASIEAWVDDYPIPVGHVIPEMLRPILTDGICAPDQERRVYAGVHVTRSESALVTKRAMAIVIQIFWSYESEFGETYSESADHLALGRGWRKGPVYLLSGKHFAFPDNEDQDEEGEQRTYFEAEGESEPKLL